MLRSLIPLLRYYRWNTNEEENEQKEERMYPQSYPTKYIYLDVEKWHMCYSLEGEFTSQMDMIMAFDAHSALIKSKDDMVYGVGTNLNGRLGLPNDNHNYIKPEKVDPLCGKNIITFHCSSDELCFYALTAEGEVYCWGANNRLGKGWEDRTYTPFKMGGFRVEIRITHIACNSFNCFALTDSGRIYIWGRLGFTTVRNNYFQNEPCELLAGLATKKIVQIACGSSFNVVLSDDGKLYIWGRNQNGQLGINTEDDICLIPCLITSLENVKIIKIVCGWNYSLALTSKGKIYSWGNNAFGQLEHGRTCELKKEPTMLHRTAMGTISDIAAQLDASVAVNKFGEVYVWGLLGYWNIWKPIRIECSNMHNVFRYKIPHIIHDSTREQSNTLKHLKTIFDDQSTSDFTIEVEGKHIHVHKAILIRCDYFKNMLQHGWREARKNTIKCNDFSYKVYKSFFKYLYTDAVDNLSMKETIELLKLCDKYIEKDVAKMCVEIIKENVNVSNVALCFATATECNAEDLMEFCTEFSFNRMTDVVKSEAFAKLNKELLLDFIRKTSDAGAYIHA